MYNYDGLTYYSLTVQAKPFSSSIASHNHSMPRPHNNDA